VSYVRINGLTKQFAGKPPTTAMDDLDLEIEQGEFLVLLGPSGCGKTTTLRCMAGLETPDRGSITLGDKTVFDSTSRRNLTPDKRNIGMVFQSYALWPHMTVRKNIGYPLKARKINKAECKGWVEDTAALVDCSQLLDRYPGQLSGGQQQRVALARGLVARPDVVLFDEPLSNLDARLRDMVRAQLHELHTRLRFTAVFVTHDQSEALALGDRMAIMRAGRIEQFDTPERVFEEPGTEYVAEFIGMSNRLPLQRQDGAWMFAGEKVNGEPPIPRGHDDVFVRLRPDDLLLSPVEQQLPAGSITFPAEIVDSEFGGRHMDVIVSVRGTRLHAKVPSGSLGGWARTLQPGQQITAGFPQTAAIYYGADDTRIAGHVPVEAPAPVGASS
jgi:iron(III) transport system ATP-binding protein